MSNVIQLTPFASGTEWFGMCDYVAPGADTCCDAVPAYEILWADELLDGEMSGSCAAHVVHVDRNKIKRISSVSDASRSDLAGEW